MGNGILFTDSFVRKEQEAVDLATSGTFGSLRSALSGKSVKRFRAITESLREDCEFTWAYIESEMNAGGVGEFCRLFFMNLNELDENRGVVEKFKPRTNSSILSRNHLLVRVIRFLLTIDNEKFKVKARIRQLGRNHATRGIVEHHFVAFAQALQFALIATLGSMMTPDLVASWASLLNFVVEQLSFDKVVLVSHCTMPTLAHNSDSNILGDDRTSLMPEENDFSRLESSDTEFSENGDIGLDGGSVATGQLAKLLPPLNEDNNEDAKSQGSLSGCRPAGGNDRLHKLNNTTNNSVIIDTNNAVATATAVNTNPLLDLGIMPVRMMSDSVFESVRAVSTNLSVSILGAPHSSPAEPPDPASIMLALSKVVQKGLQMEVSGCNSSNSGVSVGMDGQAIGIAPSLNQQFDNEKHPDSAI